MSFSHTILSLDITSADAKSRQTDHNGPEKIGAVKFFSSKSPVTKQKNFTTYKIIAKALKRED